MTDKLEKPRLSEGAISQGSKIMLRQEQRAVVRKAANMLRVIPDYGPELADIWEQSFEHEDKNEMIGLMVNAAWVSFWKTFREYMAIDSEYAKIYAKVEANMKEAQENADKYDDGDPRREKHLAEFRRREGDLTYFKEKHVKDKDVAMLAFEKSSAMAQKLANEYRQSRTSSGFYTKTTEVSKFMDMLNMVLQAKLSKNMDLLIEVQRELSQQQKKLFPITINQGPE